MIHVYNIRLAQNDGSVTGNFETAGDRDVLSLTVDAESNVTINATTVNAGEVDTFLRLYDASGNLIAQNDDSGGTLNSSLSVTLAAGRYDI